MRASARRARVRVNQHEVSAAHRVTTLPADACGGMGPTHAQKSKRREGSAHAPGHAPRVCLTEAQRQRRGHETAQQRNSATEGFNVHNGSSLYAWPHIPAIQLVPRLADVLLAALRRRLISPPAPHMDGHEGQCWILHAPAPTRRTSACGARDGSARLNPTMSQGLCPPAFGAGAGARERAVCVCVCEGGLSRTVPAYVSSILLATCARGRVRLYETQSVVSTPGTASGIRTKSWRIK